MATTRNKNAHRTWQLSESKCWKVNVLGCWRAKMLRATTYGKQKCLETCRLSERKNGHSTR